MGRYECRRQQAVNEKYGKELFMLTVEFVQRTEGEAKESRTSVVFDLDGKWKRICAQAKHKKVDLSPNLFKEHINDTKAMNVIRRQVFGIKPSFMQKVKSLIQTIQDA